MLKRALFAFCFRMILLWPIIRGQLFTPPNAVTLVRFFCVFGMVVEAGRPIVTFLLALLAWLSDGIDGFIAKRYGWCTELGARLDQWADWGLGVALMCAIFIEEWFTWYNVPLILVIGRYLVLRMEYLTADTIEVAKLKTFLQFFGGVVILSGHAFESAMLVFVGYLIVVSSLPLMYKSLQEYSSQEK